MPLFDSITIKSTNEHHIEQVMINRQQLIDSAVLENNRQLLEQIILIDKRNMVFLNEQKNTVALELRELSKIQAYAET